MPASNKLICAVDSDSQHGGELVNRENKGKLVNARVLFALHYVSLLHAGIVFHMRWQQQTRRRRRRYNHGLRLKGPQWLDTFAFNQLEIISRAIIIVGAEIGVNPNIAEPGYPGFIILRFRFGILFFKTPIRSVYKELHTDRETGC